jgi:ADP-ribosylglycohydrolase
MGVPYEFREPGQIGEVVFGAAGTHNQPPGTWSDDGALMLALLDSLTEVGFVPVDQARRFLAWVDDRAYTPDGDGMFDIGRTTAGALARARLGTPAIEAGGTGERDSGNGSLMRIVPLALVELAPSDIALVEQAHLASRVTHGHPRCQVACALYVLIARRLLTGGPDRPGALDASVRRLRELYADGLAGSTPAHASALEELMGWTDRSGTGFVLDSFWSAWDAFALSGSYAETIQRAVRYGHDTDTTAAIAGGLAGIYWGLDETAGGIPGEWLAALRGREIVEPLIQRLAD